LANKEEIMKSLWSWLRALPVARYIKPLWKSALKALVHREVEDLRGQVKVAVVQQAVPNVDALFEALDRRLDAGIEALPLPEAIKAALRAADGALDARLDALRAQLDEALASRGPGAVDGAFDAAKAALDAKIDEL
jgi:hypothetical protein